jgi:hypothetical protein
VTLHATKGTVPFGDSPQPAQVVGLSAQFSVSVLHFSLVSLRTASSGLPPPLARLPRSDGLLANGSPAVALTACLPAACRRLACSSSALACQHSWLACRARTACLPTACLPSPRRLACPRLACRRLACSSSALACQLCWLACRRFDGLPARGSLAEGSPLLFRSGLPTQLARLPCFDGLLARGSLAEGLPLHLPPGRYRRTVNLPSIVFQESLPPSPENTSVKDRPSSRNHFGAKFH